MVEEPSIKTNYEDKIMFTSSGVGKNNVCHTAWGIGLSHIPFDIFESNKNLTDRWIVYVLAVVLSNGDPTVQYSHER